MTDKTRKSRKQGMVEPDPDERAETRADSGRAGLDWSDMVRPGVKWPGVNRPDDDKPEKPAPDDLESLVELYLNAMRLMIDALPAAASLSPGAPRMGSEREILMLLARAQSVWLTSGLRYWKQMAEILASHGIGLADLIREPAGEDDGGADLQTMRRLKLLDEARACLREISDASMSEAEALRAQLMKIETDLRATQDQEPAPLGKRHGRWKP